MESELNRKTTPQSLTDNWDFSELLEDEETINFEASTLLAAIINRAASFCVLYTDPDYFKLMSDSWWAKWAPNFLAWIRAMEKEYNPIENYDRQESWHEDIVDDGETTLDSDTSDTNTVSAFDSSSYQPHDKNTGTVDGNIGVTTSQQMIESELRLRYNNIYNMIADIYVKELFVAVY